MYYKLSLFLFSLLLFASCDKSGICENDAADALYFEPGETYCLDKDHDMTITEINDSRCPLTVTCVWEGNAIVHLKFDNSIDTTVTYQEGEPNKLTMLGYEFKVDSITPYPVETTDDGPYKVYMTIK